MARCPICGKDVETPNKEWNLGKINVKQYVLRKEVPTIREDGLGVKEVTQHGSS